LSLLDVLCEYISKNTDRAQNADFIADAPRIADRPPLRASPYRATPYRTFTGALRNPGSAIGG
jgi:hypothetical protein